MPLEFEGGEILAINGHRLDWFIYLATCLVDGISYRYVGLTQKAVESRWNQHLRDARKEGRRAPFHEAIALLGAASFSLQTLYSGLTQAQAYKEERRQIIEVQKTRWGKEGHQGWNATDGGEGLRDETSWQNTFHNYSYERFHTWPHPNKSPELCEWIKTQRAEYARGDLSHHRAGQLESIRKAALRWTWNREGDWHNNLKNLNTHLWDRRAWPKPSESSPQEQHLYSWVVQQRRDKAEGKLSRHREDQLNEINFPDGMPDWTKSGGSDGAKRCRLIGKSSQAKKTNSWDERRCEAFAFVHKYGDLRRATQAPRGDNKEENSVDQWWRRQAKRLEKGELDEAQASAVRQLNELIAEARENRVRAGAV